MDSGPLIDTAHLWCRARRFTIGVDQFAHLFVDKQRQRFTQLLEVHTTSLHQLLAIGIIDHGKHNVFKRQKIVIAVRGQSLSALHGVCEVL